MSAEPNFGALIFSSSDLDESVPVQDDFYDYAVGGWLKAHPIPDDYSRWGIFEMVAEFNNRIVKTILEDALPYKGTPDEAIAKQVSTFYAVGMLEEQIEKQGLEPLQSLFAKINALATPADVVLLTAELHRKVARPFFNLIATADAKQSDWVITGLLQGGLGLPERDYYLAEDERSKTIRAQYLKHLAVMFTLMGDDEAIAKIGAEKVMQLETQLAQISMAKEDLRDPVKNYHKMELKDVQALCPTFDWAAYFVEVGLPIPGAIDVGQLEFFKGLTDVFHNVSIADVKTYFRISLIRGTAPYLSSAFVNEQFRFYGQELSGQKQLKPRWKRVVDMTDDCLGKAVGKLYVRDHFSPIAKERCLELVNHLLEAMGGRIAKLTWMSEETKVEAMKKLNTLMVKIGYPDVWLDYSPLEIKKDSLIENVIRCYTFEFDREIAKIGKPVDRTEWLMNPHMVNAYYEPSKNEIVFPAGILQPPFFDDSADDAMNYGGIGAVIGHEITHAFDDQGRQFDSTGNLRDWWTEEDQTRFTERAKKLVDQFNGYSPVEGIFVNGQFTLGENIADLGGLQVALDAFMKTDESRAGELIDDFTPLQRFFLSYAQTWKTNIREEKARLYVMVDPHSPAKFRTNGPLCNMPSFFAAYNVTEGNKMFRADNDRVVIW